MARYHLGVLTTGAASGSAAWEIRSTTSDRAEVREIGFSLVAATATTMGLGRPGAIGVTPTSPVTFLAGDPASPTGTITSALAWGTGPTVPAAFLRRQNLPGAIGNSWAWYFGPGDLIIPVSGSIVLWNLALNSVVNAWAVIDE